MNRDHLIEEAGEAMFRSQRVGKFTWDEMAAPVVDALEPLIRADEAAKSREVIEALALEVMDLRAQLATMRERIARDIEAMAAQRDNRAHGSPHPWLNPATPIELGAQADVLWDAARIARGGAK